MVKGLDLFRLHFWDYANRYVLIGGTACDIAMAGAGLEFRATKDLDIVLVVEALVTAERTRQDLNLQPSVPKTDALSN